MPRARGLVLALLLVALLPQAPAAAVQYRKWGQALDLAGAKVFACKVPTRSPYGVRWRVLLRSVNRSADPVVVSVRTRRYNFAQSRFVLKDLWRHTVQPGSATRVDEVFAMDRLAGNGRYRDSLWLRVVSTSDGRSLEWQQLDPRGVPRCSLPVSAIAWQGSGSPFGGGGRYQVCSNLLRGATGGPSVFWRFRADSRQAAQDIGYSVDVTDVESGRVLDSWARRVPPGQLSDAGSMTQSIAWVNSHREQSFTLRVDRLGGTSGASIVERNIC